MSRREALREQRIKLIEFRLRRIVVRKSSGALDLADSRIKGAVSVLGRAEIAQPRVWLAGKAFQERCGQSRLTNARFTGEQHHLPFAALGFRPAPQKNFEFFFSPNKLGQPGRV